MSKLYPDGQEYCRFSSIHNKCTYYCGKDVNCDGDNGTCTDRVVGISKDDDSYALGA